MSRSRRIVDTHKQARPASRSASTDWAELGGSFQTATTTTADVAYAGVKLRLKVRWPHRLWNDRTGLAVNGELSAVPSRFETNVWGSEIRPIVDLSAGALYASVNPILATDLAGKVRGHPQFAPAVKLAGYATGS